jgi:RNA polymerase sigma factor (sigma-70 family)
MYNHYDLLTRCKNGDAKSQRILYDLFKAKLMGLCRRYARNREEAQDVLQEAFIRIFNNMHQLESPERLESWMKSIAVHTAINQYHRTKRHELIFSPSAENNDVSTVQSLKDLQVYPDEFLISLVNNLPDGCRMVFNLYAIEGYSHAEIAEKLKVSEGTSRSQFHHAKYLLKEKLKCQDLAHYYEKFA